MGVYNTRASTFREDIDGRYGFGYGASSLEGGFAEEVILTQKVLAPIIDDLFDPPQLQKEN